MPRNALKAVLVQEGLRQHHEKRRPHSKLTVPASKVRLVGGVSIDERPAEVDTRAVPGHWEGDLIKGEKNRSEVGVLLERQTRRIVLARLTDAKAVTVREAFEAAFRMTPPALRKTLTYDQGSEVNWEVNWGQTPFKMEKMVSDPIFNVFKLRVEVRLRVVP
jgi:IS30 family transposase